MLVGSFGCEQPTPEGPLRVEVPRASALFLPPVGSTDDQPTDSVRQVELPPMEWFNNRAAWPAATDLPLGEITFYRERYFDRQYSHTGHHSRPVHNTTRRTFEVYRTGTLIR
jgi:hypothetical protein